MRDTEGASTITLVQIEPSTGAGTFDSSCGLIGHRACLISDTDVSPILALGRSFPSDLHLTPFDTTSRASLLPLVSSLICWADLRSLPILLSS